MLTAILCAATLPVAVADGGAARPWTSLAPRPAKALAAWSSATSDVPAALAAEAAPKPSHVYDPMERAARRERVEGALRAARALLDDADPGKAKEARSFASAAYAEARAHPEDPECPLWLGEALRALGRAEALGGDSVGAAGLLRRAHLLDGGRLLGLSEPPTIAPLPPLPVHVVHITVASFPTPTTPKTRVYLDGTAVVGEPLAETGEHHLRVVVVGDDGVDGPLVDARFFAVGESDVSLVVGARPEVVACSGSDLSPALGPLAKDASATFEVRCARWARVVPRADGGIFVQRCGPTRCDPGSVFVAPELTPKPGPTPPSPSWLRSPWTWAAIGVGVAAAAGLTAWGLGAFDKKETPPPTWRWEPSR